jgi:spermidine synthase
VAKVEIIKQKGYNFLWIDGHLWMWDIPEEVEDQKEIAEQARGDVLVAGYGLGVVQRYLLRNNNVNSVVTVELLEDIMKECQKVYGTIYGEYVVGDFYEYQTEKRYDCIIGDIWPDLSPRHLDYFTRFKIKAQTLLKPNGKILGWGMDYMEFLLQKKQ